MTAASPVRVLLITKTDFTHPRDGGTLRVNAIVERLRDAGCDVDPVAVRTADGGRHRGNPGSHPFTRQGVRSTSRVAGDVIRVGSLSVARWFSPTAAAAITQLLERNKYDCAVIEYSQLLIYRRILRDLPVFLDMHNIEYELLANYAAAAESTGRRALARYETGRVRRVERRAPDMLAAVVTVSERDADTVRAWVERTTPVVPAPNGVAESAFTVEQQTPPEPRVVFVGHLGWQPNIDAGHWLVEHVWPRVRKLCPHATLQLVGRSPARSLAEYDGEGGVSVHADVPSTYPYLASASVATAPLLAAGGTRLKILEALATGTPVVATSLGALGLEHLAGRGGLTIEDTAAAFAESIAAYIAAGPDPAGIRASVEGYRWHSTLTPLVDLVLNGAHARSQGVEAAS